MHFRSLCRMYCTHGTKIRIPRYSAVVEFDSYPTTQLAVHRASTITERRKTQREGRRLLRGGGGDWMSNVSKESVVLFTYSYSLGVREEITSGERSQLVGGTCEGNIQEKNNGYVVFKRNIQGREIGRGKGERFSAHPHPFLQQKFKDDVMLCPPPKDICFILVQLAMAAVNGTVLY
jgi:hypothetical protein